MRILFNVQHPNFEKTVTFWVENNQLPEIDKVYSMGIESTDKTQSKSSFKVQFITQETDETGFYYVVYFIPFDTLIN